MFLLLACFVVCCFAGFAFVVDFVFVLPCFAAVVYLTFEVVGLPLAYFGFGLEL